VAVDDAGVVYWSNTSATVGTDNTLMMKAPGGMPTLITAVDQTTAKPGATNMVKSITLDGKGNLYYGDNDDLDKVAAMAASTPTKVGTFEGQPIAITLSPAAPAATTRIFTALALDNAVQWRNPDPALSGCADPVARPVGNTTTGGCAFSESIPDLVYAPLPLVGTQVLFANGTEIDAADTTIPATMQVGRTTVAMTDSFDPITGFASTATTVYFGEATTGIIEKATLPMSAPVIITTNKSVVAPSSFALDDTSVYWRTGATATDSCVIQKLPL
jgi:hypothetical protein